MLYLKEFVCINACNGEGTQQTTHGFEGFISYITIATTRELLIYGRLEFY